MYKGDSSKYPVEEGNVLRVYKRDDLYNRKLGYMAPHKLYIWIQKYRRLELDRQPKDRRVLVTYIHVPKLPGEENNIIKRSSEIRKVNLIQTYLKKNKYQVIGRIKFNYNRSQVRKLYRLLGLRLIRMK